MISFKLKSIFFQLAMMSFLATNFASSKDYLRLFIILGNIFLLIWEYRELRKITIDTLLWCLLIIIINFENMTIIPDINL